MCHHIRACIFVAIATDTLLFGSLAPALNLSSTAPRKTAARIRFVGYCIHCFLLLSEGLKQRLGQLWVKAIGVYLLALGEDYRERM